MPTAIVTGSGGLVGAASVRQLVEQGFDVVGLENDMRAQFFGASASTSRVTRSLVARYPEFRSLDVDVRDSEALDRAVRRHSRSLQLVIHAAAQPSHDWAASEPQTDFTINANGTLNLLEALREHRPDATFVFCSTNKVYGDRPNSLPLVECDTRLDLPRDHRYYDGVDTSMSIDQCTHSLFGASKLAADVIVQEYGRYFDMPTVCFRAGCMTGADHAGAEAHGFLSYLMRCTVTGDRYTVFGYDGKQVRDNLHASDAVQAFAAFHRRPRAGAVYNLGGGRDSSCSLVEAVTMAERIAGKELERAYSDHARTGDHRWWISDLSAFQSDYPEFTPQYGVEGILREIHDSNVDRWSSGSAVR
jgi:CDP-paratose 2-epimerase